VKMWRRMIIEIHLDTATVEAFQRGHGYSSACYALAQI
jgi:hypothetical protein